MELTKKIIFWGTPEIAKNTLQKLVEEGFDVALVITGLDKPVGRKQIMTESPVKTYALSKNIKVLQPEKINDAFLEEVRSIGEFDLSIVVAYGKIIPQSAIDLPKLGTINVHYSLLPRWRGASPVEASILGGDETTGITIQKMALKMDTGDIIKKEEVTIGQKENKVDLKKRLEEIGAEKLVEILPDIFSEKITLEKQDEELATYCKKINKEDGDITQETNDEIKWRKYRAFIDWPRTYFFAEKGERKIRVIVTNADFVDGKFVIKNVLPEGKKETTWENFSKN